MRHPTQRPTQRPTESPTHIQTESPSESTTTFNDLNWAFENFPEYKNQKSSEGEENSNKRGIWSRFNKAKTEKPDNSKYPFY